MKQLFYSLLLLSSAACAQQAGPARLREATRQTVVLNNSTQFLPLKDITDLQAVAVHFDTAQAAVFDSIAAKYAAVAGLRADTVQSPAQYNLLHDRLKLTGLVIVHTSKADDALLEFVRQQEQRRPVIIVFTGTGDQLARLNDLTAPLLWSPGDTPENVSIAAQAIFGGVSLDNKLDQRYSARYSKGAGYPIVKIRLGFTSAEAAGFGELPARIDSAVAVGIAAHSAPGAVVLLVKNGQVIFHKAYGYHTYDGNVPTRADDIFDLASVTKISATTQAVMYLYDRKRLDLDAPVSRYVAALRNYPDKKDLTVRETMLHEAGFTPYIKFYELLKPLDMSFTPSAKYPVKVADGYYLRAGFFQEVMWPLTLESKVLTRGKFVYSDLSMYMMKEVVESIARRPLDEYVQDEFYRPLGMRTAGYLPRLQFDRERIVPTTENDYWFRNMPVQGYVNDPGAAMAGGVQGHAGLFAGANDLAILYQMMLNKGVYGGKQYYRPATVELFTSSQSKVSTRGLGFARFSKEEQERGTYPSPQAYGHSGYTGTYVWVDPAYDMIYICLTNRVYPDDNKTYGVAKVGIRPLVLDIFYQELLKQKNK
ncbi:serine hydrolase domain-containing protein [Chitinophaga lutea]